MIRTLITFCLLSSTAFSQPSIVTSGGGRSIVTSGTVESVAAVVLKPAIPKQPTEAELLKLEIEFLKSSLAAATAAKPPVVKPPAVPVPQPAAKPTVERWLVSEAWCPHCPAAKARFIQSGGTEDHVLTIAAAKQRHGMTVTIVPFEYTTGAVVAKAVIRTPVKTRRRLPVVRTRWGTIDLETYHKNCNCEMCMGIRALQRQYRQQYNPTSLPAIPVENDFADIGQDPTPDELIAQSIAAMNLTPSDVLSDLGCGDARILIAAVRKSGCLAIGVELDPIKADEARRRVLDSGLSGRVEIITGDALDFDPAEHGVTAIFVHLYDDLLEELLPKFLSPGVRVVAAPYHQIPGLPMQRHGDVWVYKSLFGDVGTSHESRESLIDHLLTDPKHPGRHSSGDLVRMSDEQLDALHSRDHAVLN